MSATKGLSKGLSLSALSRISQAGTAFLLVLSLAAILPVDEFGLYVVAISIATISQYVISYWLSTAILREVADTGAKPSQRDLDGFLLGLLGVGGIATVAAGMLSGAAVVVGATAAIICAEAGFICMANRAASQAEWSRFAAAYGMRSVFALAVPLGAAVVWGEARIVLTAYAAAVAVPVVSLRARGDNELSLGAKGLFRLFRQYFPLSVNAVLRQTFDRGDRIAVGALFGLEAAGVYGLAADVVRRPMQTLAGAAQAVLLPRLSQAYSDAADDRFRHIWRLNGALTIWLSALTSSVAVAGLAVVFVGVFGGKYPDTVLWISAAAGISASLEALDTYHASTALIAARKTKAMPSIYFGAAVVFLAAVGLAAYFDVLALIPLGVIAANAWGFAGINVLSRSVVPVAWHRLSVLTAGSFWLLAVSATLWGNAALPLFQQALLAAGSSVVGAALGLVCLKAASADTGRRKTEAVRSL